MEFKHKTVWVSDPQEGFVSGQILDLKQDAVTVSLINTNQTRTVLYDQVYPAEDVNRKDVDDNCALMYLNEATLLNNVRRRYCRDQIYTYVANILIALNPYKEIPGLYSTATIQEYQGKSLGVKPPHVFAIADKAYRDMKRWKKSQSVIVSGESGAGKTESQKYILRYLCESWGSHAGPIEQRILDTNPILEAFGNAKTLRNNNSSRFGKFVEIHFTNQFVVSGGFVSHYLLEKSRICSQQSGERNYHIFYQLCAGAPPELVKQLNLGPPDIFRYLNKGCTQYFCSPKSSKMLSDSRISSMHAQLGPLHDPIIDDVKDWRTLDEALKEIGLSNDERFFVYATVAAVLHLGNVRFVEIPEDTKGGCTVDSCCEMSIATASGLLGIDKEALRVGLTSRIMTTTKGGAMGTVIRVPLKTAEAAHARDALSKAIYSRVFDYIVAKINECIPFGNSNAYIGVLDIAGFEYFCINSFEQFCINYCNEKLQAFFNNRILKQEQELYEKEGLGVRKIDYQDNQDCIDLIEARPCGIFEILDEENKLPRPNPQHFTTEVHQRHKNHFRLQVPRKSKLKEHRDIREDEGFLIRHFAGAVCYSTAQFIDKNNDALHASLEYLMEESQAPLLKLLFVPSQPDNVNQSLSNKPLKSPGKRGRLGFVSVGSKFRSQLAALLSKMDSTDTNFVRCIKPNSKMVPQCFEGSQILSQLVCSGMTSVLELMQQGFPSRTQFSTLYDMYRSIMPQSMSRIDPRLFCKCLFKALGLNDQDYKFGLTKVFFRPGKFAEFDQMLRSDPEHLVILIAKVKQWLIRSRWKKAQWGVLSVIKLKNKIKYRRENLIRIQSWIRSQLTQRHYKARLKCLKQLRTLQNELVEMSKTINKLHKGHSAWFNRVAGLNAFMEDLTKSVKGQKISEKQMDGKVAEIRREVQQTLADLRMQLELEASEQENLKRVQESLAKQKQEKLEEENKRREMELLHKKKLELEQQRKESAAIELAEEAKLKAQYGDVIRKQELEAKRRKEMYEQERRDYELALRLAKETNSQVEELQPAVSVKKLEKGSKFDLSSWRYADLRDAINTSNDIELLEACREEFHKRLRAFHQWKERTQSQQEAKDSRMPQYLAGNKLPPRFQAGLAGGGDSKAIQRYFKIPFVRPSDQYKPEGQVQKGWWYAHFDGRWIGRQMEFHPAKAPVLLVAGKDDLQMCELSIEETGLTRKRGAEMLACEFELEWQKAGGLPYVPPQSRKSGTRL